MKGFLLLSLLSLPAFADQTDVLGMARDQQVLQLTKLLNEYCENNYPDLLKEKDALLLCHMQLEADCDSAESKLKSFACDIKGQARYFERNAIKSHALTREMKKDYIGSQLERLRDPCKFDKSLPECNIKYELASDREKCSDGKKVKAYNVWSDTDRIDKICDDGKIEPLK